jgi:MraZ protein
VTHVERVGLKQDVMLIAYNDRIEIWDKAKYFDMIESSMADFADLADEVMGEIDRDE